jgi:hypothetical protein
MFLLGIPAIVYYLNNSIGIPFQELIDFNSHDEDSGFKSTLAGIKSGFKVGFIRSMVLIVLLQWMFFNILEFQYTKAIEQEITNGHESLVLHDMNEFGKASTLITDEVSAESEFESLEHAESVYDEDFENEFAKDLAMLQILFGAATLAFQLLLASRLLSYLGVVGSMLVYPVVLLCSMLWMTLNFNFISAITTRFNHEVSHVLHMNAYHSSYYALSHKVRVGVKEFLEGFVRPMGAIFGTLLLIGLAVFFEAESLTLAINIAAVVILFAMFVVNFRMRPRYDDLPKTDLMKSDSLNTLINALNIIEQNAGHHDPSFLIKVHKKRIDLPLSVQKKLIDALGNIGSAKHVSYLIDLAEERKDLLYESVHAINNIFARCAEDIKAKPFTWYSLRKLFQNQLSKDENPLIRAELISFIILSNYHKGLVDEIMQLINSELDEKTISVCAETLRMINDDHVVSFLRHMLKNKNPRIKSALLYVMSEYVTDYSEIYLEITDMLSSKDEQAIIEGLVLCHKLRAFDYFEPEFIHIAINHSSNVRILFLIKSCCFHLGYKYEFTEFLYTEMSYDDLFEVAHLVEKIAEPMLTKAFRRRVYSEIHYLYIEYSKLVNPTRVLTGDQLKLLIKLQKLYQLVDAHKEYYLVEEILR